MEFIARAGVWQRDAEGPCRHCRGPGGHTYVLERTDMSDASFCDLRCWSRWWDEHVELTGEPNLAVDPPTPFQPHAWQFTLDHWGQHDPDVIGITRAERRSNQYLLYRDTDGILRGILRRTPTGALGVLVDADHRGQGVGSALVRAAGREWGIDRSRQTLTSDGAHLTKRILPPDTTHG